MPSTYGCMHFWNNLGCVFLGERDIAPAPCEKSEVSTEAAPSGTAEEDPTAPPPVSQLESADTIPESDNDLDLPDDLSDKGNQSMKLSFSFH